MITTLFIIIAILILISVIVAIHEKNTNAFCKSKARLDNKTAIVTGGTAGMGLEIAKDFAKRGARVIVCCPFENEGRTGLEAIVKESGNKNVVFKLMDLSSLASVRKFANDILKEETRLDILVNNAGVSCPPDVLTKDGLNFIVQVNYFGHFLLTLLLLPLLRKTAPSRIIHTSSLTHRFMILNPKRLNTVNHNWVVRILIYAKSKFCVVPFARELTERLKGTGVVANCVDPGFVGTNIFQNCDYYGSFLTWYLKYVFKNAKEGAQTAIHVAVDESLSTVSGKYFGNCALLKPSWLVFNKELQKQIWEESVKAVKISDDELEKCFS